MKHFRVETFPGVKRQLLCQFGRLTPSFVPVPAFNAGNSDGDFERQFGPSNLGQSMDYHILGKSNLVCGIPSRIQRLDDCDEFQTHKGWA